MRYEKQRIKDKFYQFAPGDYWGDDLDVRYYLVSQLRKFKNKQILEIGCGSGIILSEIDRSNRIFGIDKDLKSLSVAKKLNSDAYFIKADIDALPLAEKSFDVIILAAVIECSSNKEALLRQISTMLKRDGILFITTNNKQYSYYIHHTALLSYDQLEDLLKPYFTFKIKGYNQIPPIFFFLPRVLKERVNRRYQLMVPSCLLSKVPFIDNILMRLMRENRLTRASKGFYIEARKRQ